MGLRKVRTNYGILSGVEEEGYVVFKGVPYAMPPVGERRLRAPEAPEPWEGERKADRFPACSVQGVNKGEGFYGKEFYSDPSYRYEPSEDCLYLNIWTPAEQTDEKLPVAFWIHGGGYGGGNGAEMEFDGRAFCRHGVILVTVNYRLGLLGFMAHPWLSEESEHHVSGNYGILDQIRALTWVYENIAAFGGDPENITVFGQSAGCMSVQTLVSSPLTKGMIRRAILQSCGGYHGSFLTDRPLKKAEKQGVEITSLGQITSLEQLRSIPAEQFLALAGVYMAALIQKIKDNGPGEFELPLGPVVDGYVLPKGYHQTIEDGDIADIPYIIGSCRNDLVKPADEADSPDAEKFLRGSVNFARTLDELGQGAVYVYRFDRQLPGDDMGAFHSSELWYMFGTLDRCWRPLTEADRELSEEMVEYWTNFCRSGSPNGGKRAEWSPCTAKNIFVKHFDIREAEEKKL